MNLTKISVKRPLTMIMAFCILIVFGYMGYVKMPVNLMPDIDMPMAAIITTWSGAGPEDVEEQVTEVIEEAVSRIGGVDTIMSISSEGMSAVMLKFDFGMNMTDAMSSVRDKVDMVQRQLPDSASKPTISQADINASAIATLVVTSDLDAKATKGYAEDIVQAKLEQITGVTSADIRGGSTAEIIVEADPTLLSRYGISLTTLSNILSNANMTFPYGTVTEGEDKFTVRSFTELTSLEDIEKLQVPTSTGKTIDFKDVAKITYEMPEAKTIFRYNGQDSLMIDINKQQTANTVQIMQKVKKAVDNLNEVNSDYSLKIISDESEYINSSMQNVWSTLFLSSIVAFFVILVFLKSFKASFIVALAIPISIIGAVAALFFSGQTMNLITVGGLVLGVGMVVDNSIVVIENIFKKRENKDLNLEEASLTGTSSVTGAIIASTLTTVAVFLPMLFTEGMIKMMFGALSLSIIYALLFSVLVGITLVPGLFNKLSSSKYGKEVVEKPTPLFDKFMNKYENLLKFSLSHKLITILLSIILLIGSFSLTGNIGMDLMPSADKGTMSVSIELPKGINLTSSDYYLSMAEEKLLSIPEIETMTTSLDTSSGTMSSLTGSPNKASIGINLVPLNEREKSTKEISKEVKSLLQTVPDCKITVSLDDSMMSGMSGFSIQVSGPNIDVLEVIVKDVEQKLKQLPGFEDVTNSLSETTQEARIEIDSKRAAEWGVNTSNVTSLLRMSLEGADVTTAKIDDYTVDVNLKLKSNTITSLDDLLRLNVLSQSGIEIPISSFATIEMANSVKSLSKTDGKYTVTISATLDNIDTGTAQKLSNEALKDVIIPRDYAIGQGAQAEMMSETFSDLALALIIAILLVYMVMVAQFESFKKPFIILFCIPFGFVGVIASLIIFNSSLSIPAFIGVILLVGIVVNNGIVLIDYIEQLRKETSMSLFDCTAHGSATRLRPVLMTTLTTVLAMIPMIMGIGEGSETMRPMGIVVAGGLTVSTLVTLILIPTIYLMVESKAEKRELKKQAKKLKKTELNT